MADPGPGRFCVSLSALYSVIPETFSPLLYKRLRVRWLRPTAGDVSVLSTVQAGSAKLGRSVGSVC